MDIGTRSDASPLIIMEITIDERRVTLKDIKCAITIFCGEIRELTVRDNSFCLNKFDTAALRYSDICHLKGGILKTQTEIIAYGIDCKHFAFGNISYQGAFDKHRHIVNRY